MFLDKSSQPTADALAEALGSTYPLWREIAAYVAERSPKAVSEWKFSGAQYGWSFRLKDKKRNLIYLLPGERSFRVSFALGERAVAAALTSALPESLKDELRGAKKYAEGRPLRIEVSSSRELAFVEMLVDIKVAH